MSLVFEALKRAGKGKKQTADSNTPQSQNREWVLEEQIASGNGSSPGSDGDPKFQGMPSELELRPKSWLETMEEMFFGWGLKRYKSHPIVVLQKGSPASEQYKILREHVKRLRSRTRARSISISSPITRDGKTMVAVNLAAAIALDYEEQVLLIDGDLRGPEVHRYFGIPCSPGLADYLSSDSNGDLMNYVQDTFLPGLRVLPAGKPSALSSELLARDKMRNIMEEIRSRFPGYQIIVDSPPILSTPDPLVLARQVDGILMVIRAGKTPREYLSRAVQSLTPDKMMGIVLNGVELGIGSKHYFSYKNKSA